MEKLKYIQSKGKENSNILIPTIRNTFFCNSLRSLQILIVITIKSTNEKIHASYLMVVPMAESKIESQRKISLFAFRQCRINAIEVMTKKKKYISVKAIALKIAIPQNREPKNPERRETILS